MAEIDRGASESRDHNERRPRILMVTLIVALLFAASLSLLPAPSSDVPPSLIPAGISYTSHVAISINTDAQFNNSANPTNGVVSGNGTVSNPYIIENWDINAASVTGIYIQNTNAYFVVRNCYIHSSTGSYFGIRIFNCVNGVLFNNSCSNDREGIRVYSSSNFIISNNNISGSPFPGIVFSGTSSCTISNNNCSNNNQGISLDSSSNYNTISNNTFRSNSNEGIWVIGMSQYNRIWNNTFIGNKGGGIQARNDGVKNIWNSSSGYGNYWSDLTGPDNVPPYGIVDWSYNITGSAGAKDWYPRTTPVPPIPEFSELIVPTVGLMLIALIFNRTREKP